MLTLKRIQEQFNGKVFKSTDYSNTYCVVYPNNKTVYDYNVTNLIELAQKIGVLDSDKVYTFKTNHDEVVVRLEKLAQKRVKVLNGIFGLVVKRGRTTEEIKADMLDKIDTEIKKLNKFIKESIIL